MRMQFASGGFYPGRIARGLLGPEVSNSQRRSAPNPWPLGTLNKPRYTTGMPTFFSCTRGSSLWHISSARTTHLRPEIGRNRACRPNHLIRDAFEGRRNSNHERDCNACSLKGFRVGDEGVLWERVRHDFLRVVHALSKAGGDDRCQGSRSDRPLAGLPFTTAGPPATSIPS